MPISFSLLKQKYPNQPKAELFNSMGGEWPSLIDNANYANTCCVRLSLALAGAGLAVPAQYKEAITGAGTPLIVKVATMGKFLEKELGKASWGMSIQPGTEIKADSIPKRSGILVYHVAWKNATGHFDLWTGSNFVGSGNFDDISIGFDVAQWFIE